MSSMPGAMGGVRIVTVLAGAVAVACGGDGSGPSPGAGDAESAPPPAVVRDSAGVRIHVTPAERVTALSWSVDPTPIFTADGTEGGLEPFHLIASMAFDSDRSFVLGEMAMTRLRRYSLDGGFDRTVGHPGRGPGEFGAMNHISLHHDSLVVFDSRWNRVSVFDPGFDFARSFRLATVGGQGRFQGLYPDGRILGLAQIPGKDRAWGLWNLQGESLGLLEAVPALPPLTLRALGPSDAHGELPPMRPLRPSRFGAVAGNVFVWLDHGEYAFDVLDPDGRHLATHRIDIPARTFGSEEAEAWKTRTLAGFDDPSPAIRRSVEEAELPETLPSFGNGNPLSGPTVALADDRGRIWMAEYPGSTPQRWYVFEDGQGLVGRVTLPDGFELEAVRGDLLLGVSRDTFDVQTAVVHRLIPD